MIVGKIQILGKLGTGGQGVLHLCVDERGFRFAVKFPKSGSVTSMQLMDDEERRLLRHQGPHVVQYLGRVNAHDGRVGFALELMEGDLSKLGRLSPSVALQYLEGIINGLAAVHASAPGAFHGDLKRANVLVKNGQAKLSDFGLARGGVGQTVMFGPHQGGTPGYFPPEGYASQLGDLYSLGALFWSALIGIEPNPQQPPLGIRIPGHPKFERVVQQLLAQQPGQRLSLIALKQALPELRAEAAACVAAQQKAADEARNAALTFAACAAGVFLLAGVLASK